MLSSQQKLHELWSVYCNNLALDCKRSVLLGVSRRTQTRHNHEPDVAVQHHHNDHSLLFTESEIIHISLFKIITALGNL